MPIESFLYIDSLTATNPVHTDGLSQADSHLRGLKTVLKNSFPGVTGPVTATHTSLNLTTSLTANLALKAAIAGQVFTGAIDAPSVKQGGNVLIPQGVIVLWSGAVAAVPAGWHLCDGTLGTPNLRDQFVVGAGSAYAVNQTGGFITGSTTTTSNGAHSHGGASGLAGAQAMFAFTDVQGAHSHTGTSAGYALTINDIPSHNHGIPSGTVILGAGAPTLAGGGGISFQATGPFVAQGGGAAHSHGIVVDGAHGHTVTVSAVSDHQHAISSDGAHVHTAIWDNRPPFYSLAYIMKL